tara:strand:+ start:102003 stop:102350 length:348 start_codon:yes stop_codon:yes gene_type:complete
MGRNSHHNDYDDIESEEKPVGRRSSSVGNVYLDMTDMMHQELAKLSKGEESDYIGLNGKNKLERAFGLVSLPVVLPLLYIAALPAAMNIASIIDQPIEKNPETNKKPTRPNRDIM